MKNEVVTVQTKNQGLLTYIKSNIPDNLSKLHHKLKIKQIIYGRIFHVYCDEMDFSKSNIIVDNR